MTAGRPRPGPLPPPGQKEAFVRAMFARIAGRYDRMNRLMTLGRDRAWRAWTVAQALEPLLSRGAATGAAEEAVLDVGAGTGDLSLEVVRRAPWLEVVGVDLVPQMLEVASGKAGGRIRLVLGDALRLPFPDARFDAVVTGFALRNVLDIPGAISEMARVTRPGGRLASLEIARPRLPGFRGLYSFYFYSLVPLLGRLLAGESSAYTYLPHSLTAFLTPDEIAQVMRRTGWRDVHYRRLMLGTVAVHAGTRLWREAGAAPAGVAGPQSGNLFPASAVYNAWSHPLARERRIP